MSSSELQQQQQAAAKDKEPAASGTPPIGQRTMTPRVDRRVVKSPTKESVSNGYINLCQCSGSPAHRVLSLPCSSAHIYTVNLAAICTPADYNTSPLDTIYNNFIDALPVVKYCSENNKHLIHFSTCEVYGKTIGNYLSQDSPLRQAFNRTSSLCSLMHFDTKEWSLMNFAAAISVHQLEALDRWEQHECCAYEIFDKDGNRAIMIEELASELGPGPLIPVHSVLHDWIRYTDRKLSFLANWLKHALKSLTWLNLEQ